MLDVPAPRVTIIIPCFNEVDRTKACWSALKQQTPLALEWEAIFVDNASTDGTSAFLSLLSAPAGTLRNEENLGFGRACNAAARIARGKYLLFLNNDTEPLHGWLEPVLKLIEDEKVGIVGSKLLFPDGRVQHAGVAVKERGPQDEIRLEHVHAGSPRNAPWVSQTHDLQCVTGACLLIRKELFDELGGFDEAFVNGYEDIDLCLRVRERGLRVVFCAESELLHHESASAGRHRFNRENAALFQQRWGARISSDERELHATVGREDLYDLRVTHGELKLLIEKIAHVSRHRESRSESFRSRSVAYVQRKLGIKAVMDDLGAVRACLRRLDRGLDSIVRSLDDIRPQSQNRQTAMAETFESENKSL